MTSATLPPLRRALLPVLLAAGLGAGGAQADTYPLGRFAAWTVFGGTAEDGKPLCGCMVSGSADRSLLLKYFQGSDALAVQLVKRSWRIPDRTPIRITFRFDQYSPWSANAVGSGSVMQFNVQGDRVRPFMREFTAGNRLVIAFPGSEAPWAASMAGSSQAISIMLGCMDRLRQGQATQPYAGGGAGGGGQTQPYANVAPSGPTQPFTPDAPAPRPAPPRRAEAPSPPPSDGGAFAPKSAGPAEPSGSSSSGSPGAPGGFLPKQ